MKLRLLLLQAPTPIVADAVQVLLRLLFGWLLFQTGLGKLLHLDQTAEFFQSLGLPLPKATAALIGAVELGGGLLLAAGLATRPAALMLMGALVGALATAHRAELMEGLEALVTTAPFPYLVALVGLAVFGPGRLSLDYALGRKQT